MKESNNMRILTGMTLRLMRLEKGYTVAMLTRLTKTDRSYLTEIEQGSINAGIDTYEKICKALNIKMSELMASGEEE